MPFFVTTLRINLKADRCNLGFLLSFPFNTFMSEKGSPKTRMKFILLIKFDSSNYTWDDFELYNFYIINKIGFTITFLLATVIYFPTMYVIFTQSPKRMKVYSIITAYELTVAYTFTLVLFVAQPVFLFPYKGAYITGFWQAGERGNPILFFLVILNIVFIFHAVANHILYRLGSLYTSDHKLSFFSKPKNLNGLLIPVQIVLLSATISEPSRFF